MEDDIADEINFSAKIEEVREQGKAGFDILSDRINTILDEEDKKRWVRRESRDSTLFYLQAFCWIVLVVVAAVLLFRNLKRMRHELS